MKYNLWKRLKATFLKRDRKRLLKDTTENKTAPEFIIPQEILDKIREYRKEVGRNPISDEVKKEMEIWFSENYIGDLDLLKIHEKVMKKRVKFLDDLRKEDPFSRVSFMPMTYYYKDEIKELYSKSNNK